MTRIDRLRTLADDLEKALVDAPVSVMAQLAAQYRATLAELETLDTGAEAGDPVDEVARRRAARGAGPSANPGRAAGRAR